MKTPCSVVKQKHWLQIMYSWFFSKKKKSPPARYINARCYLIVHDKHQNAVVILIWTYGREYIKHKGNASFGRNAELFKFGW